MMIIVCEECRKWRVERSNKWFEIKRIGPMDCFPCYDKHYFEEPKKEEQS